MSEETQAGASVHRVEFSASAGEYFRIWIVNLALTIVTLGVYSAWAKVRRKRYFYAHTAVDGDNFEYRGNPLAILKGRLVALAIVAVMWTVSHFEPILMIGVLLAAIFVVPWLLVRSFAFNAHNSAFRNIRFHFRGTYGRALKLFAGYGLLTIVTLGLGYFWLKTRMTEFIVRSHQYGTTPFEVADLKKGFFRIYGHMIGLGFLLGLMTSLLNFGLVSGGLDANNFVLQLAVTAAIYVGYVFIFAYVRAGIVNATWNQATLGNLRFSSHLRPWPLFVIYLSNIAAILATLGLATPWAVVRTMRYRAASLLIHANGGLQEFVAAESANVSAAGEEVGEMLDFDFSL
jgi:uncharacterized membrane protein YjgN (DUF898 family)